jgi:hypothetical protein
MRQRRETVEHPFGTLKMRMGATHFLMKRLPKVATEMALHILAYNRTRVMSIMGVRPLLVAMRAWPPNIPPLPLQHPLDLMFNQDCLQPENPAIVEARSVHCPRPSVLTRPRPGAEVEDAMRSTSSWTPPADTGQVVGRSCHSIRCFTLSQWPSEAKFVTIRVRQVEEPLAPFGIARCCVWTVAGCNHARMEGVNIGMVKDNTSPPRPISLGRLGDEIEKAGSSPKARKRCVVTTTVNDLKSQHAIKADGARHIMGRQRDGTDALDHRGNAPLRTGLAGIFPALANQVGAGAASGRPAGTTIFPFRLQLMDQRRRNKVWSRCHDMVLVPQPGGTAPQ